MNWLKNGSGYTVNDLVYYSGMFLGIIVVFGLARPYGIHPIITLVVGIVFGAGLGYTLERFYRSRKGGSSSDE